MNKKLSYTLFTEKYRPEMINDMILPNEYKKFFKQIVKEGEVPNLLLFSSTPGTGKTSIAKAICNEIDAEYLYINISSESGIDTLRDDISRFASNKNVSGTKKIVIMDEADGMSPQLAKALRAEIEHYQNTCRFIFTCNYVNKIHTALRSRLFEFDFNMNDKKIRDEMLPKVTKRLCDVLTFEKIVFQKPTIEKLVSNLYPDIRKMYGLLQQYSKVNGNIDENIFDAEIVDNQFYEFILNKKLALARQFMIDNGYSYEDIYSNLYREFVPMINDKVKQAEVICVIADFYHKSSFVNDKEIIFSAMLIEIMRIL
jgi:DNA polymerase III delta prime subunit